MTLKDVVKAEDVRKRPARRSPIHGRNILTVEGKDPSRQYRIVNDQGDRVEFMKESGYRVEIDANLKVGDRRIGRPSSAGTPVTMGVGGGAKAVVMSIEKELYEEDQRVKQEEVMEIEKQIRREAKTNSDYGKLEMGRQRS